MADAAVGAGAELIVWASLPNVTEMSGGKLSNVKNVGTDSSHLVLLVSATRWEEKLIAEPDQVVR